MHKQQQKSSLPESLEYVPHEHNDDGSGCTDSPIADSDKNSDNLSGPERPNVSLPALAVAAVNACDSPSFLNAKARLVQEQKAFARLKQLKPLMPISVPQRAIAGNFGTSPSSGSPTPTPTDFSPLLLPKAEENLTALISEHNQQKRQQLQQLQAQQFQQMLQQQQAQQQLLDMQIRLMSTTEPPPEQPAAKRPRMSNRGRKKHSDIAAGGPKVEVGTLSMYGTSHVPPRRSSLGSTSVSVDSDDAATDGTTMRKGPWLATEDEKLLQLVEKYGAHDWSFIAEHIHGRVGKQCRERYFNHLAPDVRKEAWTDREDDAIVHAHHVVGNKWTNIAKILGNGRSPNSIKNRWHSSLKNRLGEHGGEAAVMEATGASSGCQCDCKNCDCSCKVACVAFHCQCCFAAHHPETTDDAQTNSAVTATDDESTSGGSSSSASNTPAGTAPSSAASVASTASRKK